MHIIVRFTVECCVSLAVLAAISIVACNSAPSGHVHHQFCNAFGSVCIL